MKGFFLFYLLGVLITTSGCAGERDVLNAIKEDEEVAAADKGLNDIYWLLGKLLSPEEKEKLKEQQRIWLKIRDDSFDKGADEELLLEAYSYRIYDLKLLFKDKTIPVELVLQRPEVLNYLGGRLDPKVAAEHHIAKLPEFIALRAYLDHLEAGRWAATSYMTHRGSIIHDINAARLNFEDKMSFAPELAQNSNSFAENLLPLHAWSYETLWNRQAFIKLADIFAASTKALASYYKTHYDLSAFSHRSRAILAAYVLERLQEKNTLSRSPVFVLISGQNLSIDELKPKVTHFTKEEWSMALSVAILRHYPAATIEWIIDSGADVNALVYDETPLMKAVDRPDIMALLIKKSANVNAANPFGKTALFYAVQFNHLEAVKLLIDAKAEVNRSLQMADHFKVLAEKNSKYLLEKVAGFTPLIYSLRYASPEVTSYLLAHGAKKDVLPPEAYTDWVLAGNHEDKVLTHPERTVEEIKKRLAE